MNLKPDSYPSFLVKTLMVIIFICIHVYTQKKPIDDEKEKKNKSDDS